MKKICFVIDRELSPNSYAFLFPLLLNKDHIDHEIEIFYKSPIKNYDYIFIDSKFYNNKFQLNDFEFIRNDLENLRKKCNKLIYCDNEASIFINNLIFDYVDVYLKGRLPSDLNIYKKKLYGQREFTEYYNKKFGIIDSPENYSNIIEDKNLKKIILGWNNGICDYTYYSIIKKKLFILTKKLYFNKPKFYDLKKNLISGRFKQNYNRNTINFHRKLFENICYKICDTDRIHRLRYFQELKNSFFSLSPFGWGEICYRDFESFSYGCLLLKPNMDHINTWPNYYLKNETYISLDWDQTNSSELERIIDEKENYKNIAEFGYLNYLKYFDNNNKFFFKKYFEKIISDIKN
jgi:hypothetical protein